MKTEIVIYTDGASKGNPGPAGWGFFASVPEGEYEACGGKDFATNNEMELTAAIKALKFALDNYQECKIYLYTDSTYVKNGITKWMAGWIRNGWKTAARKEVKNKGLWTSLNKLNQVLDVEWRWVKGHSNSVGNQRADDLANKGVPKNV